MNRLGFPAIVLIVAAIATPSVAEEDAMDHSAHGHDKMEMSTAKIAAGAGVVHAVDVTNKTINLTHEPMPDLGWPTMTMDLAVTKKVDLSKVKSGDKITFKLKQGRDKKYRVIELETVK